ncbi:MAG: DUF4249 domain-containing protein [Chitinophagaceae bacterium]
MRFCKSFLWVLFIVSLFISCRENYEPSAITNAPSILVVDGFLDNSVSDTTYIQLRRTSKLDEGPLNAAELGAVLTIEDESSNPVYYSQEAGNGSYIFPGLSLDPARKYKLRIRTTNGGEYLSDELTATKTLPIDSIGFDKTDKGVDIYVNTHDPDNNTWYYRWDYSETFQYHAMYYSTIIFTGNRGFIIRPDDQQVYECWKTEPSTQLLLATSSKLSQDVIYKNIIRHVDQDGVELMLKYFIKVKQYALTKAAYEYYENLKKISEETGSLFDIQPSQVSSNIHSVSNSGEDVLGYMTVATPSTKEIYITNSEVQPWNYSMDCEVYELTTDRIPEVVTPESPLGISLDGGPYSLKGVYVTSPACADCTFIGGVTKKPDFWQ